MSDRDLSTLVGGGLTIGRVGGADRYMCSLLATAGVMASFRPDDGAGRGFASSLEPGTPLQVSFAVADGAYVADVDVRRWSASERILAVSSKSPLSFAQRRSVFRVPLERRIELCTARGGITRRAVGTTIEMSTTGFSSVLSEHLEPGERAAAVLHLGSNTLLMVVRTVLPGSGAKLPTRVRIEEIDRTDLAVLTQHLRRAEVRHVRTRSLR